MVLGYGKLTADGPSYAAYAAMRAARLGGLGVKAGPTSRIGWPNASCWA